MHSSEVRALRPSVRRRILPFRLFDTGEVDAVLAACADALEAHETGRPGTGLRPDDIVIHQFGEARLFGEGYDADEVDDVLDRIILVLRDHEARVAPGGMLEED